MAVDHTMTQGDSVALDFHIVDADGEDVDLAGATIRWRLSTLTRQTALVSKSTDDGITVTDADGGLFAVELSPEDTEDLAGLYYHEAEVTDSSGKPSTVRSGTILIRRALIKPE